jgi:pilus assembly protein Flp/PilA
MFAVVANAVRSVAADKKGAALVEYGLLVGLIAVVVVGAVTTLGTDVLAKFTAINAAL